MPLFGGRTKSAELSGAHGPEEEAGRTKSAELSGANGPDRRRSQLQILHTKCCSIQHCLDLFLRHRCVLGRNCLRPGFSPGMQVCGRLGFVLPLLPARPLAVLMLFFLLRLVSIIAVFLSSCAFLLSCAVSFLSSCAVSFLSSCAAVRAPPATLTPILPSTFGRRPFLVNFCVIRKLDPSIHFDPHGQSRKLRIERLQKKVSARNVLHLSTELS